MTQRNTPLTADEANAKVRAQGYELAGPYAGRRNSGAYRCDLHNETHQATGRFVLGGGRLPCCASARRRELGQQLVGERNPFFGRHHTLQTRMDSSRRMLATEHPLRGKARPDYLTGPLLVAIAGKRRSDATRAKLSAHQRRVQASVDHIAAKAARGRTAGVPGLVYLVRVGSLVKIGSTTKTMPYRLTRLRQQHGDDVELLLAAVVADCGQYEADLMLRHRSTWVRGEFFDLMPEPSP